MTVFLGIPGGSDGKESACNARDLGFISGSGRTSGRGHGNALQCSCLEHPRGQEPGGPQSTGSQRLRQTERLSTAQHIVYNVHQRVSYVSCLLSNVVRKTAPIEGEKVEKVGLKLNIQKTKIMASGPITSWQIDGETVETVADFIFLGSKITTDGDCSHEIKRRLLLGRKVMTNLDSILKSRDIALTTKVHLFKAMVFPVVMYGCESWTVKNAERRRIDAFELWCWRRL